jgi:MATE family multidrug resistance protein
MSTYAASLPRAPSALRDELAPLLRLAGPVVAAEVGWMGVWLADTMIGARFEPAVLAAHQIALNSAAFTFMVPLGLSSAAAVRVGHALGRSDTEGARRAGWTALGLGLAFMATTACLSCSGSASARGSSRWR